MTQSLKERLLATHEVIVESGFHQTPINPDGPEAVREIERLEAINRELVKDHNTLLVDGSNWRRKSEEQHRRAEKAEARVAELEAGLKPFATFAEIITNKGGHPYTPDDEEVFPAGPIRWKHLRHAAALLKSQDRNDV